MPAVPAPRPSVRRLGLPSLVMLLVLVVAACSGAAADPGSPGPSAACNGADPAASGYYPDLEARLPKTWDGRAPTSAKSGRYCSAASLGTLAGKGIGELRYAGESWTTATGDATLSTVVYAAQGLTPSLLADEFAAAGAATRGAGLKVREAVTVHGRPGVRLEIQVNSVREVRVLWPSADGAAVDVVIASGATDEAIASIEEAFST